MKIENQNCLQKYQTMYFTRIETEFNINFSYFRTCKLTILLKSLLDRLFKKTEVRSVQLDKYSFRDSRWLRKLVVFGEYLCVLLVKLLLQLQILESTLQNVNTLKNTKNNKFKYFTSTLKLYCETSSNFVCCYI